MEDVGIFYGPLASFTAIRYNFGTIGILCCTLVHFFPFWYVVSNKTNLATLFQIP
jgi:hypothetical protein